MDINEVIATLKEDYELRKSLMRKKLSVQEELEDEIFDLEESYFTSWVVPKIEAYAKELLKDLECEINLAIIKDACGKVRDFDAGTPMPNPIDEYLPPDDDTSLVWDGPVDEPVRQRAGSIGFSVRFPDGTVIRHNNAKDTFIETLRRIGFERLSSFDRRLIMGYRVVSKIERTDGNSKWQDKVGDWYIYTKLSNNVKIQLIQMISDDYHLGLTIERDGETTADTTKPEQYKKPYNPEAELVVEFPDGTVFDDKKAIWNFVRVIEKIGFEKVAKVGIDIMGYNLVDTKKRTDKGRTWQKQVGDYYIYSYLSNGDKIKYLNQISNYYDLGLKIVTQ